VYDGKAAFTAHPLAGFGEDAGIMEDGGLVEQHASAVDGTCKRYLVGMEVVKCGFPPDFIGLVAENIENRVGSKEYVGIGGEVWGCWVTEVSLRPRVQSGSTYCVWS
jgi:hypothetical protein